MTNEMKTSLKSAVGQQSAFLAPAVILLLAIAELLPEEEVVVGLDPAGEPTMGTIMRKAVVNQADVTITLENGQQIPVDRIDAIDFAPQPSEEVWARMAEVQSRMLADAFMIPEAIYTRDTYGRPRVADVRRNLRPSESPAPYLGNGSVEPIDPNFYYNNISVQELVQTYFGSRIPLPPMTIYRIQAVGRDVINVFGDMRTGNGLRLLGMIDFRAGNVGYASESGMISWDVMQQAPSYAFGLCTPSRSMISRGAGPTPRCDCADCRESRRTQGGPID